MPKLNVGDLLLSFVWWALSVPALMLSLVPLYKLSFTKYDLLTSFMSVVALASAAAWCILLVMNLAWLVRHKLPAWVPTVGTALGGLSLLAWSFLSFGLGLLAALPGVMLAVVVAHFHLHGHAGSTPHQR
jgi:hypothetical protein